MAGHLLDRTSPKGTPFLGKCRYCGAGGLKMVDAQQHCPSAPDGNQGTIDALEPPSADQP